MRFFKKLTKLIKCLREPKAWKALAHGVSPSFEHEALMKSFPPISTIVDVGAHHGQFALISRICHPSAKIYSFEPYPKSAQKFTKILRADSNVKLFITALGDRADTVMLNVTNRSDSSSIMEPTLQNEIFPGTHKVTSEKITISALTDVISDEEIICPALLKIDVQGFELEVLKGALPKLSKFHYVLVEVSFIELYEEQPLAHKVDDLLRKNNFILRSIQQPTYNQSRARAIQADLLYEKVHS